MNGTQDDVLVLRNVVEDDVLVLEKNSALPKSEGKLNGAGLLFVPHSIRLIADKGVRVDVPLAAPSLPALFQQEQEAEPPAASNPMPQVNPRYVTSAVACHFDPTLPEGATQIVRHVPQDIVVLDARRFSFLAPEKSGKNFLKEVLHAGTPVMNACGRDILIGNPNPPDFGTIFWSGREYDVRNFDLFFAKTLFADQDGHQHIGGIRFDRHTKMWFGVSRPADQAWRPDSPELIVAHEDAKDLYGYVMEARNDRTVSFFAKAAGVAGVLLAGSLFLNGI